MLYGKVLPVVESVYVNCLNLLLTWEIIVCSTASLLLSTAPPIIMPAGGAPLGTVLVGAVETAAAELLDVVLGFAGTVVGGMLGAVAHALITITSIDNIMIDNTFFILFFPF